MNRDFRELLSEFSRHGVEYLVIGAHALAAHGHVRATKDLDVFVRADPVNAGRVLDALRVFGAPLGQVSASDFSQPGITFQIGVAPVRIDLCTQIDGVRFEDAWPRRETHRVDGLDVPVIGREDLIANKKATGRLQDLADVEVLEKLCG
jgi:predicted nucleotidyltransferase